MTLNVTKKAEDHFSAMTMRRDENGLSESITISQNVSGATDETYQVRNQDGTRVTIHGEEVIVTDRYEEYRYYLVRDLGGMRISPRERLHATPSGGTSGGQIDDACVQKDRALIEGAFKLYERAREEPDRFRESSPFEEV